VDLAIDVDVDKAVADVDVIAGAEFCLEVAILQAQLDTVADLVADAGDDLPREAVVLGIKAATAAVADVEFRPGPTGTAADIGVPTVAKGRVPEGIDHQRPDAEVAVGIRVQSTLSEIDFDVVDISGLVAKLEFGPELTKVVTADDVAIEAQLIFEVVFIPSGDEVVIDIEISVGREPEASLDSDIAALSVVAAAGLAASVVDAKASAINVDLRM
jgi:hypothetical protein